jgi:hypothetical protein
MRKDLLVASVAVSFAASWLVVAGCGSSGGGGTGGTGGHAGTGGHGGSGGTSAAGGMAGGGGGHAGGGGAAGGTAGGGGGHAGSAGGAGIGGAGGTAGTAGGGGGAGGTAGGGGGAAGSSAGGAAGSSAGGAAGSNPDGGLAMCGTDNSTSEGLSCNTLDATGTCVTATISNAALPTVVVGGIVQAGIYDLVSITVYPGDGGSVDVLSPVRKTLTLSNLTSSTADINEVDLSGNFMRRQTGTLVVSLGSLTFTQTCPAADAGNASGTAMYDFSTPGGTPTLRLIKPQGTVAFVVEVYQKRS